MIPPKPDVIASDMKSFFGRRERHSWIALVMAIAMPSLIIWMFILDGRTNIMPDEPVIIYAESWPADRTDEEIIERQRAFEFEANEARAIRREQFQRLADQFGVEYDREAAAEADQITQENRETLAADPEVPEENGEDDS
jgi:hypothetical protein